MPSCFRFLHAQWHGTTSSEPFAKGRYFTPSQSRKELIYPDNWRFLGLIPAFTGLAADW
jgi:hypothetical protein